MQTAIKFLIGIGVLILGIPVGNLLARVTKEELKSGQKWFKLIAIACILGAIISLLLREDVLLFTFLFILIVVSRSLRVKKIKIIRKIRK